MLKNCNEHVHKFMTQLDFPGDAQETFLNALNCISEDSAAAKQFGDILKLYTKSENCDFRRMLDEVKVIGERLNIHEYTISLLMYLCMAETLRKRYLERAVPESVFFNSMMDLRYKLEECRLVHGINGSFVAYWFYRFFNLTRFALGRLQFELVETKDDYLVGGFAIPAGSKAINVHIPRTGTRLLHNDVLDAYKMAADMFAVEFGGKPIVFTCNSWLLDPWNLTVLSPESNLAAFCNDYKIVDTGHYDGYGEIWRLFDCQYTGDPAKLPCDSSLRSAYVERISCGEPIGWGRGLFIYQNDEIIH